jgi:hypothetical protein
VNDLGLMRQAQRVGDLHGYASSLRGAMQPVRAIEPISALRA